MKRTKKILSFAGIIFAIFIAAYLYFVVHLNLVINRQDYYVYSMDWNTTINGGVSSTAEWNSSYERKSIQPFLEQSGCRESTQKPAIYLFPLPTITKQKTSDWATYISSPSGRLQVSEPELLTATDDDLRITFLGVRFLTGNEKFIAWVKLANKKCNISSLIEKQLSTIDNPQ